MQSVLSMIESLVRCPNDGADLALNSDASAATCNNCRSVFPVRNGVLYLVDVVEEQSAREQAVRDADAENYDSRFDDYRNNVEIPATLGTLNFKDKVVLDLGCGTGRITCVYSQTTKATVAVDFSPASLSIMQRHLHPAANVLPVFSDASQMRMQPSSCDIVISTQVLEHLSVQQMERLLGNVVEALRPGGECVFTAYHQDLFRRMRRLPSDGFHQNGIAFHNFVTSEMRTLFAKFFDVRDIRPIQVPSFMARRLGISPVKASRFFERIPLLNQTGHLLRCYATKR